MLTFLVNPMSISNFVTSIYVCVCMRKKERDGKSRMKTKIDYLYIQNPYSLYFSFESPLFISACKNNLYHGNARGADEKQNIDTHTCGRRVCVREQEYRHSRARTNNFALPNKLTGGLNMQNISSTTKARALAHC